MKDRKSTSQPKRPTMRNRKHEERINDEKNNHNGKPLPYFLLTFLCAGFEISAATLFCLYRYKFVLCNHITFILAMSNVPSARTFR